MFGWHYQPQEPHQRDERLKLVFDYYKHLATLTIGTAVVFLAINQAVRLEPWFVVPPLLVFAFSALLALLSMVGIIAEIGSNSSGRRRTWWPLMLELATGMYMAGLSTLVVIAVIT